MLETIEGIDLTVPGVCSLVLHDLSSYATLAFIAAFDVPAPGAPPPSDPTTSTTAPVRTVQSRVTYVALSKKTMPMLVDLYLRFKDQSVIYTDGTLEAICSVRNPFLDGSVNVLRSNPFIGVLYPDQTQIRVSGTVEIWKRRAFMENRHNLLPAYCKGMWKSDARSS